MLNQTIIFIIGPTASGKSDVAVELARLVKGEIISCDSMQVYRKLAIVSNKPSAADKKKVRHHLIDCVPLAKEFDVATFNSMALKAIQQVMRGKKTPIIVGGSGMYMTILLDGIFKGKGKNDALRKKLLAQAESKGNAFLHDQLKRYDPPSSLKIHPNDTKRLLRALEVYFLEKEPISQKQKSRAGLWGKYDIKIFGLELPRQALYDKINRRVDRMIEEGALKEIEKIKKHKLSKTVLGLIGIKELLGYINGAYDLDQAAYLMKRNTRHLAKRQLTWFRKDKRVQWLEIKEGQPPKETALFIRERI